PDPKGHQTLWIRTRKSGSRGTRRTKIPRCGQRPQKQTQTLCITIDDMSAFKPPKDYTPRA
ncbi:hypothetical protein, partial [Burkholderia multivorans]|uniref:hypothetical protein n=1 Tax=Burkholderia multivorans TaxID=87883 RepID=UPI0021BFFACF